MTKVIFSEYDERDELVSQRVYPAGTDARIVELATVPEGKDDDEVLDRVYFSSWACGELMWEEVIDMKKR